MSSHQLSTAVLGFPRIGRRRELKVSLEDLWRGKANEEQLLATAKQLRARHWQQQQAAGITSIPSNDFSFYDQVLDALVLVGATPTRFGTGSVTLDRYFKMARNSNEQTAMEMTKWFDTNYHYLVPEWSDRAAPSAPDTTKALAEFNEIAEARALGHRNETGPVIGPISQCFCWASPIEGGYRPSYALARQSGRRLYEVFSQPCAAQNVEWVQIDEPHAGHRSSEPECR